MPRLTSKDKELLEAVQTGLTLSVRPYAALAKRFGMTEEALCDRLVRWQRQGLIRYAGAVLDMKKLGVVSSLIAMRVPRRKVRAVAEAVNTFPQVSHNYERAGVFNLWFTLSAGSEKDLQKILNAIRRKTGVRDMMDLRTTAFFKRRAVFAL